ncbi:hypothetical protein BDW71DRAFT_114154 [Aspergillus fruticulosus]
MQDGRNWRIYWQYKEDTDFVARWLADTAKRCGYPDSLRIPTSPAKSSVTPPEYQKPTKLEGKAREQAKEESESELPQPATPTYKIGHEDFINLARFVSEYTKCRVPVPADFFTAIDRAIRLRKEHNSMYTSFDDISARHGHFIGILECVREILTPLDNTGTPDEATGRSNTAQDNNLANRFSGLEVQEPTESSPPGHRLTSLPTSPPIITTRQHITRIHSSPLSALCCCSKTMPKSVES